MTLSCLVAITPRDMESDQNFEPDLNLDSAMKALNMEVTVETLDNFHSAYTQKKLIKVPFVKLTFFYALLFFIQL